MGRAPELKPLVLLLNLARPSGQDAAVTLRMPEARPLPASFEAAGIELAEVVAWPELKPDGRARQRGRGPTAAATGAQAGGTVTVGPMEGIRACVFDAYGTLFDVHSAVGRLRPQLGPKSDALSELWRTRQLEYTWLRALMGRHTDFWQVTGDALDYALERTGVDPGPVREPLMQAYLTLDAYAEVPGVLRQLRDGRPQARDPVQRRAADARCGA